MKYLIAVLLFLMSLNTTVLFDFNDKMNNSEWQIEDDIVMGGRSNGNFYINDEGHGVFEGDVSLENNGGFSSLINRHERISVSKNSKFVLRVKGDGKRYQFRIKHNWRENASYVSYFETNGEWQDIDIELNDMYPTYRGNRLNRPNFNFDSFEVSRFLIGNKKAQSFQLLIDTISVVSE